jgi:hypothetical protein
MQVENFTVEQIKEIETAESVETARILMRSIIDTSSKGKRPIKPAKRQYLLNQTARAKGVVDVVAIAYNMLLAGEGLRSLDSTYFAK